MSLNHLEALYPPRPDAQSGKEIVSVNLRKQTGLPLPGALAAMVADAIAKRTGGSFIVHLDDTDPDPLPDGHPQHILNSLSWLDLNPHEFDNLGEYGPYSRVQRRHIPYKSGEIDVYGEVVNYLIEKDLAYLCFCESEANRTSARFFGGDTNTKRPCVQLSPDEIENRLYMRERFLVYFRVPEGQTFEYHDPKFGYQTFSAESVKDFVLLTPEGMPMPYLAHVVDNHFMRVTTQVRTRNDLSTLREEIMLSQALGWAIPALVHVPAVHDPAARSLFEESDLMAFQQQGYEPETMRNYLSHLIWSHPKGDLNYPYEDFQYGFDIYSLPCDTLTVDYELLNTIQRGYTMSKL